MATHLTTKRWEGLMKNRVWRHDLYTRATKALFSDTGVIVVPWMGIALTRQFW